MRFRKIISKRFRREAEGVQIAGDVNAVVSANVGERNSSSQVSSKQQSRVVQRSRQRKSSDEAKEAASE
jgi:hypothetical protein